MTWIGFQTKMILFSKKKKNHPNKQKTKQKQQQKQKQGLGTGETLSRIIREMYQSHLNFSLFLSGCQSSGFL